MSACRSCKADITWARTEAGRLMPIEYDDGGNLAIYPDPDDPGTIRCRVLTNDATQDPGERRAVSHFALCVAADKHRRPR